MAKRKEILLENVRVVFSNFSGKQGKYNPPGKRNFNLLLDDATAEQLTKAGWNIKWLEPYEEGDARQARVEVAVEYDKGRPPRCVLITNEGKSKTMLDEDTVNCLDWAEFTNIDVILNPYPWSVNGKSGIKAYLKAGYFTIYEDELEKKYRDVPDSALSAIVLAGAEQTEETPF